jgi:predicted nucleic acid-binding protein
VILDSTFLVDLEREQRRKRPDAATRFLVSHPQEIFHLCFIVAGELAAGESLGGSQKAWSLFLGRFQRLDYEDAIGWEFGRVYRDLRRAGRLVGTNDLWIAATGLVHGLPVVTRNADDFRRVPGLTVFAY